MQRTTFTDEGKAAGKVIFKSKYRELLSNKAFLRLWLAQILSLTAQNIVQFTLFTVIYEQSGKSSSATSFLLVLLTIPPLTIGSYAGVLADRANRKTILIVTNLLRTVIVAMFLLVTKLPMEWSLLFLYANAFLSGVVNQFFIPAETATIPELVKKEELLKANALFTQTLYITFILGFSLAGPIQSIFGTYAPFPVSAGMFAVCVFLVAGLPKLKTFAPKETHHTHLIKELYKDTIESYKIIKKRADLFIPVINLTVSQVVMGMMLVFAPAFIDYLHLSVRESGLYIITPAGIAVVGGSILLGFINVKNRDRLVKIGFIALGASMALMGLLKELTHFLSIESINQALPIGAGGRYTLIFLAFIFGICLSLILVPSQTSLTENAEPEIRGRIFGFLNVNINVSATLPLLIAGLLADKFSIKLILIGLGALLIIFELVKYQLVDKKNHMA